MSAPQDQTGQIAPPPAPEVDPAVAAPAAVIPPPVAPVAPVAVPAVAPAAVHPPVVAPPVLPPVVKKKSSINSRIKALEHFRTGILAIAAFVIAVGFIGLIPLADIFKVKDHSQKLEKHDASIGEYEKSTVGVAHLGKQVEKQTDAIGKAFDEQRKASVDHRNLIAALEKAVAGQSVALQFLQRDVESISRNSKATADEATKTFAAVNEALNSTDQTLTIHLTKQLLPPGTGSTIPLKNDLVFRWRFPPGGEVPKDKIETARLTARPVGLPVDTQIFARLERTGQYCTIHVLSNDPKLIFANLPAGTSDVKTVSFQPMVELTLTTRN